MTGIYTRQSIDKKDSISIDGQIDLCKKEAGSEPIQIYTDKGFSGANINRPAFKQLIFDIKQSKIDKVIVYRLDRISRSLLDFAGMIDVFKKHNVAFVSCNEKFDTSTPIGNAMLSIIMVFAQLERETIQQRIKDNYYQRGKKGMYLGGPAPYGFDKVKTTINGINTSMLAPNADSANVQTLYDMYNSGLTLGAIAKEITNRGIIAPNGGLWSSLMVSRILKSPTYVKADADVYMYYKLRGCNITNDLADFVGANGCYLYGKRDRNAAKYTDVSDHTLSLAPHEGLIESDIWLTVQKRISQNKQIKNTGKSTHTWLSGLVKCGKCGYGMTVTAYKEYKYFSCRGRTNYHVCEGNQTIYIDVIESYVEQAIKDRVNKIDFGINVEPKTADSQDKIKLVQIDQQIDNLLHHLALSSDIAADYINKKIASLHAEKQKLMQKTLSSPSDNIELAKIKQDVQNWDTLSFNDKKINAKALITKVFVTDNTISIDWRY